MRARLQSAIGQVRFAGTERSSALNSQEKADLARRLAPVLVLWPEIPANPNPGLGLRGEYAHRPTRSPSQRVSGAHISRDFHPRDVRSILDHAQAYQPRPPLPFMPVAFARAYRDLAKIFFWPLVILVVLALLVVGLAQGVPQGARTAIEVGAFVFTAVLFLVTLRSPIHAPTNPWHLINHFVMGLGLAVMWFAILGYVNVLVLIFLLVPWAPPASIGGSFLDCGQPCSCLSGWCDLLYGSSSVDGGHIC